ncbi:MAG: hypothetical protein ACE5EE_03700 [Fidelibacterota bacterium]
MSSLEPRGQLALFPELANRPSLPSITTLPEFDRAMDNLIKMSDLGAFISVNVHGVEKSFSIHTRELEIPDDFLKEEYINGVSPTFYLFPPEIRNQLKKLLYEITAFFNQKNSFKSPFGFFLFRPYFRIWTKFAEERKEHVEAFLEDSQRGWTYGQHFRHMFEQGYSYLQEAADNTAPWEFLESALLQDIRETRRWLKENHKTHHTLDKTTPDYPMKAVCLKTLRIPTELEGYMRQLSIHFAFKSIHLDYLKDVEIRTVEDVKRLSERMGEEV